MKKLKKSTLLVVSGIVGLSFFVSCAEKQHLPEKPKDKQEYKDQQGHSWIYNAAMMRWAFMPYGSNSSVSHYYYPSSGTWTDTGGAKVSAPSNVSASTYRTPSSKPNATGKNYNSSKPSSGKSFGSSHSGSKSFGA